MISMCFAIFSVDKKCQNARGKSGTDQAVVPELVVPQLNVNLGSALINLIYNTAHNRMSLQVMNID